MHYKVSTIGPISTRESARACVYVYVCIRIYVKTSTYDWLIIGAQIEKDRFKATASTMTDYASEWKHLI